MAATRSQDGVSSIALKSASRRLGRELGPRPWGGGLIVKGILLSKTHLDWRAVGHCGCLARLQLLWRAFSNCHLSYNMQPLLQLVGIWWSRAEEVGVAQLQGAGTRDCQDWACTLCT